MKRRWIFSAAAMMAVIILLSSVAFAGNTAVMYAKTANGKPVNVRNAPSKNAETIGIVRYGGEVTVDLSYTGNDGWTKVDWASMGAGYIMSRYLVDEKPEPLRKSSDPADAEENADSEKNRLEEELASEKEVEEYFYISVRPVRISGWVYFRSGPGRNTRRISSFPDGKELLVLGETNHWYKARDPETEQVGYIDKAYTIRKVSKKYVTETETADGVRKLGSLNINGDFELTCRLPEDYDLQVVDEAGEMIIASILSEDTEKPVLFMSIAYDEIYGDVDRFNDLSDEDLMLLENSFRDMNEVDISYRETGYGTKLMLAREAGQDTDFVDILSIYKGYLVEFVMTPNPGAANQRLTEAQIQMCVDFLTDVDFIPVED